MAEMSFEEPVIETDTSLESEMQMPFDDWMEKMLS